MNYKMNHDQTQTKMHFNTSQVSFSYAQLTIELVRCEIEN